MHIVLYQPQIPPNTGNISRLCVATETPLHLIRPLGFSIDDKHVRRAALDYWKDLKLTTHDSLEAFYQSIGHHSNQANQALALSEKVPRCFYFTSKASRPYTDIHFRADDYLVFGSETSGLPESIHRDCAAFTATIPMSGSVRCLNLSTSVGIVLYEALRQLKQR